MILRLQRHARVLESLETRRLDRNVVIARQQERDHILACRIAGHLVRCAGVRLHQRYVRA